jgi:hypothetical protein
METKLRHRFRLIRILENRLFASDCEIESNILVNPLSDHQEIHIHLSAMKLWLDEFVDGCIAFTPDSDVNTNWTDSVENTVMLTPTEPKDHIILALIHAKLCTIGANSVKILKTHFFADTGHGFSSSLSGPADEWLPSMSEWIGPRHFHSEPWWFRSDCSTIDLQPNPNDDLSNIPDLGGSLVDMIKANFNVDEFNDDSNNKTKMADIIKPTFKPRLVDND